MSGFGTVFLQLDKGSYSPGQQVSGTIFLNISQNFPGANEIWLSITGMEDTKLIEQKTKTDNSSSNDNKQSSNTVAYYVHHQDFNTFFNHKFPVYSFSTNYLPAGQYTFPVNFMLPAGLPSTFNYEFHKHGPCHARVNYVMKVTIAAPQITDFASIQCVQAFIVNQELIASSGNQKKEMSQVITSCCCIDKGRTKIVTYFEKNDYTPGEVAYMVTEVDNTNCKADIFEIRGVFKQILRVTARGYSELIVLNHQTMNIKGIKAGEELLGEHAKRLQVALRTQSGSLVQPTCRGKLVHNEYSLVNKLKMDARICCEHSPHCEINLNVRNAELHYEKWGDQPPNWEPQVFAPYTAQFSTEFHESTFYPPQSIEATGPGASSFAAPSIYPGTPATARQGVIPYPGHPVNANIPKNQMVKTEKTVGAPVNPGMPSMPGGPAMPGQPGSVTAPPMAAQAGMPAVIVPGPTNNTNYPTPAEPPVGSEPGKSGMPATDVPTITEADIPIKKPVKPVGDPKITDKRVEDEAKAYANNGPHPEGGDK